jgi:diaminohydroxyphosphoribosylaminopyrimidine deaminase/5-amino-6-(5-phosphoribosylamino)uracil reductase
LLRHDADAMVTGIGTVLADDPLLTDRTGRPRSRPLLRMVIDSQLRISLDSKMVTSAAVVNDEPDLVIAGTTAASADRRKALEGRGARVLQFDGKGGRVDLYRAIQWLAQQNRHSILVEAGSKMNWAMLEAQLVDRIFFYYAPKILGGTEALPMAGGVGRRRRVDAIRIRDIRLHNISPQEFAVEGRVEKDL